MGGSFFAASPSHASFACMASLAYTHGALGLIAGAGARPELYRERGSPGHRAERGGIGQPPRHPLPTGLLSED